MQAPPDPYGQGPTKKSSVWIWVVVGAIVLCGCGGAGIFGAILVPVFLQARNAALRQSCMRNMSTLEAGQLMYIGDNDDHLPAAANWSVELQPYAPSRFFTCPDLKRQGGQNGYAMNQEIGGKLRRDIEAPAQTISHFETAQQTPNSNGDPKTERPPDRHGPGRNEGYVDGHVKWMRSSGD